MSIILLFAYLLEEKLNNSSARTTWLLPIHIPRQRHLILAGPHSNQKLFVSKN
jgi:hypothetical protein